MSTTPARKCACRCLLVSFYLLLPTAAGLCWPDSAQPPEDKELQATRKIWEIGGTIRRDNSIKGEPVVYVMFGLGFYDSLPIKDDDLKWLSQLPHLKELRLRVSGNSEKGWSHVTSLKNVETLLIRGDTVTDAVLKQLSKMPKLRELEIENCNLGDNSLKHLANCPSLEAVTLRFCRSLTNADMAFLAKIPKLRSVRIPSDESVSNVGVVKICAAKGLRSLSVGVTLDDNALKAIATLPQLDELSIESAKLSREGWKHLADCGALRDLYLGNVEITDAAMESLAKLPELQELAFGKTPTTAQMKTLKSIRKLKRLSVADGRNLGEADMLAIADCAHLEDLAVSVTGLSDAGLKSLTRLAELRYLSIYSSKISPEALAAFATCQKLEELRLGQLPINDKQLEAIGQVTSLKKLELYSDKITNAGLKHITSLKNLRELNISPLKVTDEGLKSLGKLKDLQSLSFDVDKITPSGLEHLSALQNLEDLDIWNLDLTDKLAKPFGKLRKLSRTVVADSSMSVTGVKHLAGLKKLQYIQLRDRFGWLPPHDEVLRALNAELPKCEIVGKRGF